MRSDPLSLSDREIDEICRAEAMGTPVVVFVHGLWLLASSWEPWRELFESRGYATIATDWPADPPMVEQARSAPAAMAGNSLADITSHVASVLSMLSTKPIVIGHGFGGLVAQQLAGQGLVAASVPISPAPSRGILGVPFSAARASWPVLCSPLNRRRAVMLTYKQFRYAFANAVDADEARWLYDLYAVPAGGRPLFQTVLANCNPYTDARVDLANPDRGPMKIISGRLDRIVPWSLARAAFKRQQLNPAHTEFFEVLGRGHSLVIDSGWRDVADSALRFVHRMLLHR